MVCGLLCDRQLQGEGCYKGKHQRQDVFRVKGKIVVKCSSCRARVQKSKLSYRHSELGAVKVKKKKKKLRGFRPAACSLYLLCSQEREREKLILFFPFHCNKGKGLVLQDYLPPTPCWSSPVLLIDQLSIRRSKHPTLGLIGKSGSPSSEKRFPCLLTGLL